MRKFAPVLLSLSFMLQSLNAFAADNALMRYVNSFDNKHPKNYYSESSESPFGQQCKISDPMISGALDPLDRLAKYFHQPECAYKVSELKDPYSKKYCDQINRCGNIKLKGRDLTSFESLAEFELNEQLELYLVKMELVERVRKFAELSGMKDIGNSCKSRFEASVNSSACDSRFNKVLIDMIDTVAEKNKDTPDSAGGKHEYHDFKQANKSQKINFNQYFTKRVSYGMEAIIKNDDYSNMEAISIILSDSSKTVDERKALFNTYLYNKNQENRLDPILSGLNKDSSFDLIHKNFLDKALSQKSATKEDIKASLIKYREDQARELLGNETICNRHESYAGMCAKGYLISRGERVPKNIEQAQSRFHRDNNGASNFVLEAIHKKYFPGVPDKDNLESARVVLEASRCSIYKFSADAEKESTDAYYSLKVAPRAIVVKVDKQGNPVDNFSVPPKAIPVSENGNLSSASSNSYEEESIAPKAKIVEDYQPSSLPAAPSAIRPISSLPGSAESDEAARIASQKATEAVIASGSSKEIDKRLSDLTKRLEEANARITQMTNEKVEGEATVAKEQKIQAENKAIEDLRSQIAELKKKKETDKVQSTAAITSPYKKPESNSNSNDSFITSTNKRAPAENKNFLPIERSTTQSSAGPSRSPSSISSNKQITLDSSGRKSIEVVIDSNQLAKGVTLSEAILQKIAGLNGEPFYIEEGGMLKQIIPILDENGKVVLDKEGNPTYEKVTKGKSSEKIAKKDDATPLPAITTQADLQRSQDELLGRSVYQEIQKITNEVLGNENQ